MLKMFDGKKSLLGLLLMYVVEALTNTGTIAEAAQWMEPAAEFTLGVGLIDKFRKFTERK